MGKIIVAGSGFSGSVLARKLAGDCGRQVEVVERRGHIGGNMYDYQNEHGILIQKYGPHFLNTNDYGLIKFLSRFAEFMPYHMKANSVIDGKLITLPYNFMTLRELMGEEKAARIYARLRADFPGRVSVPLLELLENGDPEVSGFANTLFEKAYKTYTTKMWDTPVDKIDRYVLDRVPFRLGYDERYLIPDWQYLPKGGFTGLFDHMLDHPNIKVSLHTDVLDHVGFEEGRVSWEGQPLDALIYTGNIDELFGFRFGALPYRSLAFRHRHYDETRRLRRCVYYYPQAEGYTRDTEYRQMMADDSLCNGTTVVTEYPLPYDPAKAAKAGDRAADGSMAGGDIPYYPVVTAESTALYEQYRALAKTYGNLFLCGRLAEFKYYNMDVCVEHALAYFEEVKASLEG
jgi:UDP-galactopyranose mutase